MVKRWGEAHLVVVGRPRARARGARPVGLGDGWFGRQPIEQSDQVVPTLAQWTLHDSVPPPGSRALRVARFVARGSSAAGGGGSSCRESARRDKMVPGKSGHEAVFQFFIDRCMSSLRCDIMDVVFVGSRGLYASAD